MEKGLDGIRFFFTWVKIRGKGDRHMSETKTALVHIGGYEYAWHLTEENPERIIKNIQIPLHGRRPDRRRKYFRPV